MAMITITINGELLDSEKMKEISRLEHQRTKLIGELKSEAIKSPRYIAAFDLAGLSNYDYRKMRPSLIWNGKGFNVEVRMDEVVETAKLYVAPVHKVYIEPRTMNALLGGKLLSDAEKRKLLASVLPEGVLEKPLSEKE